jgi:3',5'-cyclic AMP phosphodiesterase CpdA
MATLLHLTDLHLSQPNRETALGDYSKAQLLDPADFQSRTSALHASLESLGGYLVYNKIALDGIVVTGDVTVAADPEGYTMLPAFLGRLGAAMVDADRVLLTPGNHDVKWSTAPGTTDRYAALLELRNSTGYRTAYLDGIDIDGDGTPITDDKAPLLEGTDGSFVVVGLNSSNHCGVDAAVEEDLRKHIATIEARADHDPSLAALLTAWKRRGLSDLPRLDNPQLHAAGNLWPAGPKRAADAPLKIAAVHHQIGPVTDIEEVKAFETMSNLGEFRKWLVDHGVDVVLHGHTHVAYNRHDVQRSYRSDLATTSEHRFLVVGGGTIDRGTPHAIVANLITTTPAAPKLRPIQIHGLKATTSKKPLTHDDFTYDSTFVRGDIEHASGVVAGPTIDDVFEQLLGLGDLTGCVRPLVCRIADGSSALALPRSYPDSPFPADVTDGWLKDTVSWWQRAPRGPGATFNHGERLKHRDGEELDQIERAAKALATDIESSRGVAVLVQPRTDLVENATFPSFVMLHATVTGIAQSRRLDLVAYFRKQEIPHWWPINMAELATIQQQMIQIMDGESRTVHPGSLTSVTSIPVAGAGIPFVGVPWLDRVADKPSDLLALVSPLLTRNRDQTIAAWHLAMADWALGHTPPADGEPVPLEGIEAVADLINGLLDAFGPQRVGAVSALLRALRVLASANTIYRSAIRTKNRSAARTTWIKTVDEERESIMQLLNDLTDPTSADLAAPPPGR